MNSKFFYVSPLKGFLLVCLVLSAIPLISFFYSYKKISTIEKALHYTIYKPRSEITLDLFEAEKYESAVVVQQLVGNLVYYSNKGRYEPRLAKSWQRVTPNIWAFQLNSNLKCENGEIITPSSFKRSIERAIFIFSKKGAIPVLGYLTGIKEFLRLNRDNKDISKLFPLEGLQADESSLTFVFDRPVKSGLLQVLSFSPFGYVSEKNYSSDGEWKSSTKFVSSGPFVVKSLQIGKRYELLQNPNWGNFAENAPKRVVITHTVPEGRPNYPLIIDAFTQDYENKNFIKFQLVPEYLNSVLLGNLSKGYFSSVQARESFKAHFAQKREALLPSSFGINTRSSSFYPNQNSNLVQSSVKLRKLNKNIIPLVIEGSIPLEGSPRFAAWRILKEVLETNKISYEFSKGNGRFEDMINRNFDIRIRGSSIGGGVEAWGLSIAFCSPFGISFPDPSGRVCEMIKRYEKDEIDEKNLTEYFLRVVEQDAAVLPVSHYGIQLFLSEHINLKSISPTMSIVRFDQLELKDAEH